MYSLYTVCRYKWQQRSINTTWKHREVGTDRPNRMTFSSTPRAEKPCRQKHERHKKNGRRVSFPDRIQLATDYNPQPILQASCCTKVPIHSPAAAKSTPMTFVCYAVHLSTHTYMETNPSIHGDEPTRYRHTRNNIHRSALKNELKWNNCIDFAW